MRIAVGLSGGVDSSLVAHLLREEGHEVIGLTGWLFGCGASPGPRSCCGSVEAIRMARGAADALGIRHEVVDLSEEFDREVVRPTVRAYASGSTPNPCVWCNSRVRFPCLAAAARGLGADALATGHYARLQASDDRLPTAGGGGPAPQLLRGVDREHDQSYFLFALDRAELGFARFALGGWSKTDVRTRMTALRHPAADRLSSQDLCFLGRRSVASLVRTRHGDADRPGPIVHVSGRRLGVHEGLVGYTVGQRKGIGIAWREPLYVVELRPATNELVVGPASALSRLRFGVGDLRWLARPPDRETRALVQIRYRTPAVPGSVLIGSNGGGEVVLDRAVRAVAPGQAAVFYDGERVIGGGWIAS